MDVVSRVSKLKAINLLTACRKSTEKWNGLSLNGNALFGGVIIRTLGSFSPQQTPVVSKYHYSLNSILPFYAIYAVYF